jgi:hypothetical protein
VMWMTKWWGIFFCVLGFFVWVWGSFLRGGGGMVLPGNSGCPGTWNPPASASWVLGFGAGNVVQVLEHLPTKCWDYRCAPPHPPVVFFLTLSDRNRIGGTIQHLPELSGSGSWKRIGHLQPSNSGFTAGLLLLTSGLLWDVHLTLDQVKGTVGHRGKGCRVWDVMSALGVWKSSVVDRGLKKQEHLACCPATLNDLNVSTFTLAWGQKQNHGWKERK